MSSFFTPTKRWFSDMRASDSMLRSRKGERVQLLFSYAIDWIVTLVIAGLFQLINRIHGFRREFSLTDPSIQYTYTVDERISIGLLVVISFVVPAVLIILVSTAIRRSIWDLHVGLLALVLAHALTLTATTAVKVCAGRLRPDFLARCQPMTNVAEQLEYHLVTESVCATNLQSHIIVDGFRSFPSGHASAAFAGLTILTLYIGGKLHVWSPLHAANAALSWLMFIPMLGAILVAVTRTMDYRHHATDVIAGGLLGFVIAIAVYHSYYPPLWSPDSQEPWQPRSMRLRGERVQEPLDATHASAQPLVQLKQPHPDADQADLEQQRI